MKKPDDLQFGDDAPLFTLPDQDGREVNLKHFRGQWVVLYFYPKDDTPGCTKEAKDFTASLEKLQKLNAIVLGVSADSTKSHCEFRDKYGLKVTLLSDPEHKVLEAYGVWQKKQQYGREFYGAVRTTYLIDPEGKIAHIWRNVNVDGHTEQVLHKIQSLTSPTP